MYKHTDLGIVNTDTDEPGNNQLVTPATKSYLGTYGNNLNYTSPLKGAYI
jgi:hypothetical protein